ncbi:gamma-carboxygeranoyl-CoA hydratase [Pseudomonas saudimassiliensis]|uniref:Gamma-carboxygeranoyl-CoA hydratase n=1 Tax=Pseudomonas saudimassiliensis TaxID=1461581 RepID=A0A078MHI6_9PSED|nr:gamma-carboxygeranoyl-CoA hydratase [Pseudomonas saudimassiliensis]CEA05770.1 gamma-carboxygeranoyl-CoA hydratase [Pseudomonas saudimassiliensis]CEF27313.1 gamma-carboxygeranoyl-CoA hydratase [Pseudomonas saudimassiliensis]
MQFNTIQLERHPRGYATLWLNRVDKHNAFNAEMIEELLTALDHLREDHQLRFLLLRGRGKHFCAGADLQWMRQSAELDYTGNLRDAEAMAEVMYRLYQLPMPTLAVVQGAAFGGALGLIACCDIAIGAEDAQLSLSEVRIGLAPAVISPFVVKAMGERASRRYAISGERFSGRRAEELGLLTESCPSAELEQRQADWITTLLQNSPQAMRASKALVHAATAHQLSLELRHYTQQSIVQIRASAEGREGIRAFLEKRTPNWIEE